MDDLIIPVSPDLKVHPSTPTPLRANAEVESPYTGTKQKYEFPYFKWQVSGDLGPMVYDEAKRLRAFFAELRGTIGVFRWSPPAIATRRGDCNTSGVTVVGSGQLGRLVNVAGLGSAKTLLLGSFLEIEGNLYTTVSDVTANGAGNATIKIEPPLRTSPANGALVILESPSALWELADEPVLRDDRDGVSRGSVTLIEAI